MRGSGYASGSSSGNDFLGVLANNFDVLAGPLVGLVYPLYASIQAIEISSAAGSRAYDQLQWLTYWVLYSLITIFELTCSKILECFPIWGYAKLFLTCWLVLPQFNGATYVYKNFIRPFYMNVNVNMNMNPTQSQNTNAIDWSWYMPTSTSTSTSKKKNYFFNFKQDHHNYNHNHSHSDILAAAERYMIQNGTEDFQRLIRKAEREAKARKRQQQHYMLLDEDTSTLKHYY